MTNFEKKPLWRMGALGRRLLGLFGAVLILGALGAGMGLWALERIGQATQDMTGRSMAHERLVGEAVALQALNAARYKAVALSAEPSVAQALEADIAATQSQYQALMAQLAQRLPTPSEQALLEQVRARVLDFDQARQELVRVRDFGWAPRIEEVYEGEFLPAAQRVQHALSQLSASQRYALDAQAYQVHQWTGRAQWALWVFGALSLIVGLLLALWLARSITAPIALARETAQRVADLDLRRDIEGHSRDETGHMLMALSQMQEALRHLAGQVRTSVAHVHGASYDIASGNADLCLRTEAASANLQQTAAALEQLKEAVHQAAQTAQRTQEQASDAAQQARHGQAVVSQMVQSMAHMGDITGRIGALTAVIDGLAMQTHLLALNATIEAAHAGEKGRGFATVAAEVRKLAAHSAKATGDIKALLHETQEKVRSTSALAQQADRRMADLALRIDQTANAMQHIEANSQTQNRDIHDIHRALQQLDAMTEHNAALVEQSASATDSLRSQAEDLSQLVSRFTLPDRLLDGLHEAAPPAWAPAPSPTWPRLALQA